MASKGEGLFYPIILIVLAVILVGALSAEDPDVRKLDSREFQPAVEEKAFALDPEEAKPAARSEDQTAATPLKPQQPAGSRSSAAEEPGPLTVYDESQKVTGLLKPEGAGETVRFAKIVHR